MKLKSQAFRATQPRVPWELILRIISLVSDKKTLKSLSITSKATCAEATKELYHTIVYNPETKRKLLQAIVKSNPSLAKHVRSLTMSCEDKDVEEERIWQMTIEALNLMVNLRHLFFSTSSDTNTSTLFANVTFRLQSLKWQGDEDGFLVLLNNQPTIKRLETSQDLSEALVASTLLELTSVNASFTTMFRLLNGPVTRTNLKHIWYTPMWTKGAELDQLRVLSQSGELEKAFHQVTHMSINGVVYLPYLQIFTRTLSSLRCLEVYIHWSADDIQDTMGCFAKMKTLKALFISSYSILPRKFRSVAKKTATMLFSKNPSLQHVLIASQQDPMNPVYMHWRRSVAGFTMVQYSKDAKMDLMCPLNGRPQTENELSKLD